MTSEQNVSEVESHQGSTISPGQQGGDAQFTSQNVQHGMGQSKSSRRRRRKRKNKGFAETSGAPAGGDQGSVASLQASTAPPSQPQSFQANSGQQQNNSSGGGSGKRWKKKFRDRDRQRSPENPGNVASGSNGGHS